MLKENKLGTEEQMPYDLTHLGNLKRLDLMEVGNRIVVLEVVGSKQEGIQR